MDAVNNFLISLFESLGLYSAANGLGEHLRGLDVECNPTNQSIYSIVFFLLFLINTVIFLNYYYGLFNRVNFTNLISWSVNLLACAILLFLISFFYSYNGFSSGNYCQDLSISVSDCLGFAATTAVYSIIYGFILSVIIKWKSSNNKKVPF
jgi:hypothetical protein